MNWNNLRRPSSIHIPRVQLAWAITKGLTLTPLGPSPGPTLFRYSPLFQTWGIRFMALHQIDPFLGVLVCGNVHLEFPR